MDMMDLGPWVHTGRVFSAEEITAIRTATARLSGLARKELAAIVRNAQLCSSSPMGIAYRPMQPPLLELTRHSST